jgi:hypothetical protein
MTKKTRKLRIRRRKEMYKVLGITLIRFGFISDRRRKKMGNRKEG